MRTPSSNRDNRKPRLLIVFGTRPEALKCFPVVRRALADDRLATEVCVTAQHREMVDQVIALTGMPVHYDLHVWLWKHNPSGVFAPFNPDASCTG